MTSEICDCGHREDEHDPDTGECQVDGCICVYFDEDPYA